MTGKNKQIGMFAADVLGLSRHAINNVLNEIGGSSALLRAQDIRELTSMGVPVMKLRTVGEVRIFLERKYLELLPRYNFIRRRTIRLLIDAHNEGKLIFRPHRGGYAESMSEAFVVSDLSQLEAQGLPLSKLSNIQSRAYGCDDRDSPLWLDTHIVTAIWDNGKRCPIGFTNRSIDILQQQAEE